MLLPVTCPGRLAGNEDTVTIKPELRTTAPALRPRCLRRQSAEHGQLREFRGEIDDGRRIACHLSLPVCFVAAYFIGGPRGRRRAATRTDRRSAPLLASGRWLVRPTVRQRAASARFRVEWPR